MQGSLLKVYGMNLAVWFSQCEVLMCYKTKMAGSINSLCKLTVVFLVPMRAASGTYAYAIMLVCVCMCVCGNVFIVFRDENKGKNGPLSTFLKIGTVLYRHF